MTTLFELPEELLENCSEEVADALRDLAVKVEAGEAPKGVLRLYDRSGVPHDITWGYDSEEERISMVAFLERQESGATLH